MGKFSDYVQTLPILFRQLVESPNYRLETLIESTVKDILRKSSPVQGVYIMYDKEVAMYVGRSKTLAQKIGVDERAKKKSTIANRIMKSDKKYISINMARDYLFNNYSVKFIKIDDEIVRAMFVIYVATELSTPFNSFMET